MLHFIINPKANSGKVKKKADAIEKILNEREQYYIEKFKC